jgi:hypothetical protein
VEEIINQNGEIIPTNIVLSPQFQGWNQKSPSDFLDLTLSVPIEISKIKVLDGHNVKYYSIILVTADDEETSYPFEVTSFHILELNYLKN